MGDDPKKEELRTKHFTESFQMGSATKQRFGLFSQPMTLAVGDTNYFKPLQAKKNADGEVITAPKNFTTTGVKKGGVDSVLFSKPGYISTGDPYKDPGKLKMREQKRDGFKDAGHEIAFKPAKDLHRRIKADFEHKTDLNEVKKNYRDAEGAVITHPRNFLTNPPKKGKVGKQTQLGEKIPYIEDPFDHRRELARKEFEDHQSKLQEKPFSNRVRPRGNFNNDKATYGEDIPIPARPAPPKRAPLMEHEVAFKPSNPAKKGYNRTIDKFPAHVPEDPKPLQRKKKAEGEEEKPSWKPNHTKKSLPSSSVTTNFKNLKSEFPTVFRRGM